MSTWLADSASNGAIPSAAPNPSLYPPAFTTTSGSAPRRKHEFTKNRFHYNWHWFWDYGNGDFGNQGIHETRYRPLGSGREVSNQSRARSAATSCSMTISKRPTP